MRRAVALARLLLALSAVAAEAPGLPAPALLAPPPLNVDLDAFDASKKTLLLPIG